MGRMLSRHDGVAAPSSVVLVLHGGRERSGAVVTRRSLSWQRGLAIARTLGRRLQGEAVGVRPLRYDTAGWNGDGGERIADARWALDLVRREAGDVPVVLVGHSMGGRTACRVADHELVRGVVALAPVADMRRGYELGLGDGAVGLVLGGSPADVPDRYAAVDPAANPPPAVPTVIMHGDRDPWVPYEIGRDVAAAAGDRMRFVGLPGIEHYGVIDPQSPAWPAVAAALASVWQTNEDSGRASTE